MFYWAAQLVQTVVRELLWFDGDEQAFLFLYVHFLIILRCIENPIRGASLLKALLHIQTIFSHFRCLYFLCSTTLSLFYMLHVTFSCRSLTRYLILLRSRTNLFIAFIKTTQSACVIYSVLLCDLKMRLSYLKVYLLSKLDFHSVDTFGTFSLFMHVCMVVYGWVNARVVAMIDDIL